MMESESLFSPAQSRSNVSNIPEYSVSDISGAIKRTLENAFGRVRIRGEITELKRYASGHMYLSLKDEGGKISGVIWRGKVPHLGLTPENGIEVIATGRVSSYGERSNYQFLIDRMEFAGEGALLARVERLRVQLRDEGLFASERKKSLPFLPHRVGVITSRSGAVLHDICTTIARRFPSEILLWPVAVQGDGAAAHIVRAVQGIARLPQPPDVVIVARGGGSLEDLMAFNDEAVVRAVAACPLPVISAVGHETDTTLIDHAADRRAPTPTAAAELAVPLRSELMADLAHRTARLTGGLSALLQQHQMKLNHSVGRLPDLPSMLDTARMRLEDRGQRLELALPAFIMRVRARLGSFDHHLPAPETLFTRRAALLEKASAALMVGWQRRHQHSSMALLRCPLRLETIQSQLTLQKTRLRGVVGHLQAVSPHAILERGYAIVQNRDGQPITRSEQAPRHAEVSLHFSDGVREARLDQHHDTMRMRSPSGRRSSVTKKTPSLPQGDLGL